MSDFDSPAWSIFVAVATALSLLACLVLLFIASKPRRRAARDEQGIDALRDQPIGEVRAEERGRLGFAQDVLAGPGREFAHDLAQG